MACYLLIRLFGLLKLANSTVLVRMFRRNTTHRSCNSDGHLAKSRSESPQGNPPARRFSCTGCCCKMCWYSFMYMCAITVFISLSLVVQIGQFFSLDTDYQVYAPADVLTDFAAHGDAKNVQRELKKFKGR